MLSFDGSVFNHIFQAFGSVNIFIPQNTSHMSFPINSLPQDAAQLVPFIIGGRHDVQLSLYCAPASHMFLEKGGKQAVGTSILIIRPSHLLKKL